MRVRRYKMHTHCTTGGCVCCVLNLKRRARCRRISGKVRLHSVMWQIQGASSKQRHLQTGDAQEQHCLTLGGTRASFQTHVETFSPLTAQFEFSWLQCRNSVVQSAFGNVSMSDSRRWINSSLYSVYSSLFYFYCRISLTSLSLPTLKSVEWSCPFKCGSRPQRSEVNLIIYWSKTDKAPYNL